MSHKDTKLIRSRIIPAIHEVCMENGYAEYSVSNLESADGLRFRTKVCVDGRSFFLDFLFRNTYKTTIQTGQGENQDLQEMFASEIISNPNNVSENYLSLNKNFEKILGACKKSNDPLVYKRILLDEYKQFMHLISTDELFNSFEYVRDDAHEQISKIVGKDNSEVTATYYKNKNTLMFQGKPLLLFSACASYMAELVDSTSNVEAINSYYGTDVTEQEILDEYLGLLPKAYKYLNDKVKSHLCQALQNKRNNNTMFDATYLVFPALRALEGHLKHIMYANSVPFDDSFSMFSPVKDANGEKIGGTLKNKFYPNFGNNQNRIKCINETYDKIYITRNSLFHWDKPNALSDTTRMLEISEVGPIIHDVFKLIDKYFNT